MTISDFQWLCAWALVEQEILSHGTVLRASKLPLPRESVMKKCRKCKREHYNHCIDCSYRNGGRLVERREWHEDTVSGFSRMMARDEMAETLGWMRGYNNPNLRR